MSLIGVAVGVAFVVTLLLTPLVGAFARRHGIVAMPSRRGVHRRPTPLLGGIAVLAGIGASATAVVLTHGAAVPLVVLAAGVAAMSMGAFDDRAALRWQTKLLLQVVLAAVYVAIERPLGGFGALGPPLAVGWLVLVMNAINFTDNSNGLASGTSAMCAAGLGVMAIASGRLEITVLAATVSGAAAAFFTRNFPAGAIFLGDAGSLALGFLLGALSLSLGGGAPAEAATAALALGYPLFDLVFVVVSRTRRSVHFAQGGTDHTVHRLAAYLRDLKLAVIVLLGINGAVVGASVLIWIS